MRRRTWILLGLTASSAAAFGLTRSKQARRRDEAALLVDETYRELRAGSLGRARKLAETALALAPADVRVRAAWIEASALSLVEDVSSGALAVGLVSAAHQRAADPEEMAVATLASAIGMHNDRLALSLLAQHADQGVGSGAIYAFLRGAALELGEKGGAAEAFEQSRAAWVDAVLPALRLARAHLFAGRLEPARAALGGELAVTTAGRVLVTAIERAASKKPLFLQLAAGEIDALPRSLRPLAVALGVHPDDPTRGIDAALADIESPSVGILLAELLLDIPDFVSASSSCARARQLMPEHAEATVMQVRIALLEGDIGLAKKLASDALHVGAIALVDAVSAYEAKDKDKLQAAADALDRSELVWPALALARAALELGPAPAAAEVDALVLARAAWAAPMAFDLAVRTKDFARAKQLAAALPPGEAMKARRALPLEPVPE